MTKTQNYVIWLNGFLEACEGIPSESQVKKIKDRLNDLFDHVVEPVKEKIDKPDYSGGILPSEEDQVFRCYK